MPKYDMGDPDNITEDTFKTIADEWKIPISRVKEIVLEYISGDLKDLIQEKMLDEIFKKAAKAWGQSLPEAKKKTASLIKTYPN